MKLAQTNHGNWYTHDCQMKLAQTNHGMGEESEYDSQFSQIELF